MTRNLTTLILLLLCGAGTLFAQYYPYPDMGHATVDGVTYYYDRNVGARILQTSGSNVKHDYVDVSDDHYICYKNDKGTTVCDSMYYCYVRCFDTEAKSITLPEKVLLPAHAVVYASKTYDDPIVDLGDGHKYREVKVWCRVRGIQSGFDFDVNPKCKVEEISADFSGWNAISYNGRIFQNLSRLKKISIVENREKTEDGVITFLNNDMFEGCDALENVSISAVNLSALSYFTGSTFKGKQNLQTVSIRSRKPINIPNECFNGCKNLTTFSLVYDSEVDTKDFKNNIHPYAFSGCTNLKYLTLRCIDVIGKYAFDGCKSLTKWSITGTYPSMSVSEINDYAFYNAAIPGKSLVFDGSKYGSSWLSQVKKIGRKAFQGSDVEELGFVNYNDLDYFKSNDLTVSDSAFYGMYRLKTLTIDNSDLRWFLRYREKNNMMAECNELQSVTAYNCEYAVVDDMKCIDGYPWSPVREHLTSFTWKGGYGLPKGALAYTKSLKTFSAPDAGEGLVCNDSAFYQSAITQLDCKVRSAGRRAFAESELQSVVFANGTNDNPTLIGEYAFAKSSIKSVKMLDGVYEFRAHAFEDAALQYLYMNEVKTDWFYRDNNTSLYTNAIPENFCYNCPLQYLALSDLTKTIGKNAFYGNQLTVINIPDNVTKIGASAFTFTQAAEARKLRIGLSVAEIATDAFAFIDEEHPKNDKKKNDITELVWLSSKWGDMLKNYFKDVQTISFMDGGKYCETITKGLCREMALKSVTMSPRTKKIGDYAFASNISLKAVTIPQDCEEIGKIAFGLCLLSDIKIDPNSKLKTIRDSAFVFVPFTSKMVLPVALENVGRNALPAMSTSADYHARALKSANPFGESSSVASITIHEGVESLPDSLFKGTAVSSVYIPSTVKRLGRGLFAGASNIGGTNMRIYYNAKNAEYTPATYDNDKWLNDPEAVAEPWKLNPWGVQQLNQVVNKLDYYEQFSGYSENILQTKYDVVIGEGVETIPDFLFAGLKTHRESLTLPASVKKIGQWAFYRSDIKTLQAAARDVEPYAFAYCEKLEKVSIPQAEGIAHHAFAGSKALRTASAGNLLLVIGASAFEGCENLIGFTMCDGLKDIDAKAFKGCSSFGSVTLGAGLEDVGDNAFEGIKGGVLTYKAPTRLGRDVFKDANISSIRMESLDKVPSVQTTTFADVATDIPVWVNCAVLPLFQADANWKAFTNYYARSQYTVEIYPAIDPSEGGISATVPDCDNKVTLTAEPAQLFSFKQWSDGSTENPRTITLTEDLQISAEFEKTGEYTMKYFRFCFSTPEGAVFSTDPSGWYAIEYDVAWEHPIYNIGITANEHFRIDFNMAPMPRDTKGNVVSTNAPSLMCTSDGDMENCTEATLSFDYADNSELMNANTDTIVITIPVIGEQVRLSDVLTTNDKSMGGLYLYYDTDDYNYKLNSVEGIVGAYGDEVTVYAHPITGYDFTGWDDGSTDEIRTITLTDKVYTANFEPKQFLVTFTVSDNDYTTISGQKTIETGYAYGEQVALPKAEDVQVPEAVGSFDYWEVNGKSDVATEVIDGVTYLKDPVAEDLTIVAVIKLKTYTLQVLSQDDAMGAVETDKVTTALPYGSEVTLTAKSDEGYRFSVWSDGATENPHTVTVTEDAAITAVFVKDIPAGFDNVQDNGQVKKFFRNGVIYIIKGDKIYNVLGEQVE